MPDEPHSEQPPTWAVRMEAKIDVVLSQHEQRLEDHTRRLGEHQSTLREHDSRITANALTVAETRNVAEGVRSDLVSAKDGARRHIEGVKTDLQREIADARPKNVAQWAAVAVSVIAVVVAIVAVITGL